MRQGEHPQQRLAVFHATRLCQAQPESGIAEARFVEPSNQILALNATTAITTVAAIEENKHPRGGLLLLTVTMTAGKPGYGSYSTVTDLARLRG